MGKRSTRKHHQKMYHMKGCSKTRKYLGGSTFAYTGKHIPTIPNPFLAYTGKGGSRININASNPTIPNTGPPIQSNTTFNDASQQYGGNCAQCSAPMMTGGSGCNDGQCGVGYMVGGVRHRKVCKCSDCKSRRHIMKGGNPGIPYPNGLVGSSWTPNSSGWPGVNGVGGDRNFIANNTYQTDVSRQMVDLGANPPFLKGGNVILRRKGGKMDFRHDIESEKRKAEKEAEKAKYLESSLSSELDTVPQEEINEIFNGYGGVTRKTTGAKKRMGRKQKGGTLSNFMGQDLINLGRQFNFGIGSAYNAIAGYSSPVNPMPWRDQLPSKMPLTQL